MDEVNVLLDSIERIYSNIDSIENDSFKNNFNKYILIKSNLDIFRDRLDSLKKKLKNNETDGIKEEINNILSELLGEGAKEEVAEAIDINTEFDIDDANQLLENMPDTFEPSEPEYIDNNSSTVEVSEELTEPLIIEDMQNSGELENEEKIEISDLVTPASEIVEDEIFEPIIEETPNADIVQPVENVDYSEQYENKDDLIEPVMENIEEETFEPSMEEVSFEDIEAPVEIVNDSFIEEPLQEEIIREEDHIEETEFIEPFEPITNLDEQPIEVPTLEEIEIPNDIAETDEEINLDEINSMIETFE